MSELAARRRMKDVRAEMHDGLIFGIRRIVEDEEDEE